MNKSFLDFVNEQKKIDVFESFKKEDVNKALELINKLIKKHIPNIVLISGYSDTIIDNNKCFSKYYVIRNKGNNSMFSLNWLRSSASSEIYSVDFFDNDDILWKCKGKSKLSIYTLGSSIVYFLPIIWNIALTKNYSLSKKEAINLSNEIYNESYTYYFGAQKYQIFENLKDNIILDTYKLATEDKELDDFLKFKRNQKSNAYKDKDIVPGAKEKFNKLANEFYEIQNAIRGGANTLNDLKLAIKRNTNIIEEIDNSIIKTEDTFNEEIHQDPEKIFKKMNNYVSMVINGTQRSVILCGAPGVGKTYKVRMKLKASGYMEGHNLFTIKGKCTPRQLYIALYDNKEKGNIVLIDDADALVGPKAPEEVINILKAALDSTSDDEGNLVSYQVTGDLKDDEGFPIPKRFYYNGGVIIITNWNAGSLDTALRGRSFVQDINFTTEDLLLIVERLLPAIDPTHLSVESKEKAYDYLVKLSKSGADMEISIRTFGICAKIYQSAINDPDFTDEDAEDMIKEQMELQAARGKNKY